LLRGSSLESLKTRFLDYNQIIEDLEKKYNAIDVIYAPKEFNVDRLSKDEKKILVGFNQGISAGRNYLKGLKG
jgi:predicted patatin/cPLA2 family phospholipase